MNNILPNIPRFYTALAEWFACMACLSVMARRLKGGKFGAAAALALVIQSLALILTGNINIHFWIPCMTLAVALMYLFLMLAGNVSLIDAGYYCTRAFVLAEFMASLEWQIHCYIWPQNDAPVLPKVLLLLFVYSVVFLIACGLEKRYINKDRTLEITQKELWAAVIIGVCVFAISNLSFVTNNTPFSGQYGREIFNIRTMVDLGGIAVLYAHHIQCHDQRVRRELDAMQNILQNQYMQYQQSKETVDIINRKYHDFKHQITVLRAESDDERRNAYLDEMESEIKTYEAGSKTGNAVLDTLLTGKSLYCKSHDINLTCVADGALLDFMDVMDICTVFGNALDNAIESVEKTGDKEKRLIHVTIVSQKDFLVMRFENYYESDIKFEGMLPATTKKDTDYHGYGLKSIRYVAQKYGGTVTVDTAGNWFELNILIPIGAV